GAETAFNTGFKAGNAAYVTVSAGGQVLTRGTHYTSRLEPNGILTVLPLTGMPTAPQTLLIERTTPATQLDDLINGDGWDMEALEAALDKAYACIQEERRLVRDPLRGQGSVGNLVELGPDGKLRPVPLPPGLGDLNYVRRDGATAMTGALALSGNGTLPLHAVPKQQLDAAVSALQASQSRNGGGYVTHTFPSREGTVATRYFIDPENGDAGCVKAHYGKTIASVETFLATGDGIFATTATNPLNIKTPYGIDIKVFGGKVYLTCTSYTDPARSAFQDYYDQWWYIFRRDNGVWTQVYIRQAYGAVDPTFQVIDGVLSCSCGYSVSSLRNGSGGSRYDNCYRQSAVYADLIGSTWTHRQELMNTQATYMAEEAKFGGVRYTALAAYYDDNASPTATGGRRYSAYVYVLPQVSGLYSISNWAWRLPAKGAAAARLFERRGKFFCAIAQQRGDANAGDSDPKHFETEGVIYELLPLGKYRKVKTFKNFNCNMVRIIPIGEELLVGWCNVASGGTDPTDFDAGELNIMLWDDRVGYPVPHATIRGAAFYDFDAWLSASGNCMILTAEYAVGNSGTYLYERASRCINIGPLVVTQAEAPAEDKPQPDARTNRIVNSGMRVSQLNGSAPGGNSGYYPIDLWQMFVGNTTGLVVSTQQASGTTVNGSPTRLLLQVTTPGTLTANSIFMVQQRIAGERIHDFKFGTTLAEDCYFRFMFKSSVAGTFGVVIRNAAAAVSWCDYFTISADQIGVDVLVEGWVDGAWSGTWPTGADGSLLFGVTLAAGSNFLAAAQGWNTDPNKIARPNITNNVGAVANFEMSEPGLYLDTDKQGRVPLWQLEPIERELAACQRYFERQYVYLHSTANFSQGAWAVPKAKIPTITFTPDTAVTGGTVDPLNTTTSWLMTVAPSGGSRAQLFADARP
ncbi:MAG: hypothetical protein ACRDBL_09605, partial [Rhabdaerophilum sp.]